MAQSASEKRPLIIASGDCSDADGFLTIPLYKASGADVIYFVNFSAIFDDSGDNYYQTDRTCIRTYEYPVNSSAEFAIPGYVHRGNWKEFYNNKFRDFSKYKKVNPKFSEYLSGDGKIKPEAFTDDNGSKLKKAILDTFYELTYRLIYKIWTETKCTHGKNKIYVVACNGQELHKNATEYNVSAYHINKVNPFALYLLGDDVDVYADILEGINDAFRVVPPQEVFEGLPGDTSYTDIYFDFNGSMAFWSHQENWIKNLMVGNASHNAKKLNSKPTIHGVYMMGGVECEESPKTLSMFSIVRYACATVNQLFHPENTKSFLNTMKDMKVPIYVATNNYVNRHDIWDLSGKNSEIEPENALYKLFATHKNWIPASTTLYKMLFAYYGEEARLVRIYDVPVAMKLVMDVVSNEGIVFKAQPNSSKIRTMFIGTRGVTLVSASPTSQDSIVAYKGNLAAKFHNAFSKSMEAEITVLEKMHFDTIPCIVFDDDITEKLVHYFRINRNPSVSTQTVISTSSFSSLLFNRMKSATEEKLSSFPNSLTQLNVSVSTQNNSAAAKQDNAVMYDFSSKEILVVSDWEGGVPVSSSSKLQEYLTYDNTTLTINPDNKNLALIFLGDLIDNANHNIRLMLSFLELKEKHKKDVLLVGGNRDFNKIRLADEHFMLWDKTPCITFEWKESKKLEDVVNTICDSFVLKPTTPTFESELFDFAFNADELVNPTYKVKPWHINNMALFTRDFVARINRVYLDMYGIADGNAVSLLFDELVILGCITLPPSLDAGKTNLYKTITVTLFNMLASRKWTNPTIIFKNEETTALLNGLYVKYMEQCHIAAIFKQGVDYGFVSHGSVGLVDNYLTTELGLSYELTKLKSMLINNTTKVKFQECSLLDICQSYEDLKTEVTTQMKSDTPTLVRSHAAVEHLIHMTAATKYFVENTSSFVYHHSLSPVLGYRAPRSTTKGVKPKMGGSRKYIPKVNDKAIKVASLYDRNGQPFKWVIYGHQPRGIVPAVALRESTYYVCMDVSKIEGQTNMKSYAALVIGASGDRDARVFGSIDFEKLEKNTVAFKLDPSIILGKVEYDYPIDVLRDIQAKKELNISYKYKNAIGNGTIQNSLSPVMQDKQHTYFYASDFMGTSPSPVISNKIFIASTDVYDKATELGFGELPQAGGRKVKNMRIMSLVELRKYAKSQGIKGASKMSVDELKTAIKNAMKPKTAKKTRVVIE